jgi:hypothetical protein
MCFAEFVGIWWVWKRRKGFNGTFWLLSGLDIWQYATNACARQSQKSQIELYNYQRMYRICYKMMGHQKMIILQKTCYGNYKYHHEYNGSV